MQSAMFPDILFSAPHSCNVKLGVTMKLLLKYIFVTALYFIFAFSVSTEAGENLNKFTIQNNLKMSSPFFTKENFIYPEFISVLKDGTLFDNNITDRIDSAEKIRQTAECSSDHVLPHTITRAYAWKEDNELLNIYLEYESVEVNDHLLFTIFGDKVSVKYWTWPTLFGDEFLWEISSLSFKTNKLNYGVGDRLYSMFDLQLRGTVNKKDYFNNHIQGYIKPDILNVAPKEFQFQKPNKTL
jgi:hypothetical protein